MSDPIADAIYGPSGPISGGISDARVQAQIEAGVAKDSRPPPVIPRRQQGAPPGAPIDAATALYGRDGPARDGPADSKVRQAIESGIARSEPEGGRRQAAESAPFDLERLSIPEDMEVDRAALAEFGSVAKALKLDHQGAEKLIGMHTRAMQARDQAFASQVNGWADETQRHFGDQMSRVSAEIREAIGSDRDAKEFFKLMDWSGLGNNASVIRILRSLAQRY